MAGASTWFSKARSAPRGAIALRALQLALGAVLLVGAAGLVFHRSSIHEFARTGFPDWVRLLLAWSEIVAAALFLVPRTAKIGGGILVVVLLFAIGLHLKLGQLEASLVIDILVILAVLSNPPNQAALVK